jgi:hypothetical protein
MRCARARARACLACFVASRRAVRPPPPPPPAPRSGYVSSDGSSDEDTFTSAHRVYAASPVVPRGTSSDAAKGVSDRVSLRRLASNSVVGVGLEPWRAMATAPPSTHPHPALFPHPYPLAQQMSVGGASPTASTPRVGAPAGLGFGPGGHTGGSTNVDTFVEVSPLDYVPGTRERAIGGGC